MRDETTNAKVGFGCTAVLRDRFDVDVIFVKGVENWRVPPTSGEYTYHLESTDAQWPRARVTLTPYSGNNPLRQHGMLRVAANKRYFELTDGTPFYWLGDTWWTRLSDRLNSDGFQKTHGYPQGKRFYRGADRRRPGSFVLP